MPNNKLWRQTCLIGLLCYGVVGGAQTADACPAPLGEWLAGTGKTETAQGVVPTSDGDLVLFGARVLDNDETQAFAFKTDPCGGVRWLVSLTPTGGSNFLSGLALPDGSVLLGGSTRRLDNPEKNDALLVKLDKDGRRLWMRPFQGEQNLSATNLLARRDTALAVLQPHIRKPEDDEQAEKLKPEEERPVFLELGFDGRMTEQFAPLTEERVKLFHIREDVGTDALLVSGRFSYFGQPTRPGIWRIDRQSGSTQRIFNGKALGLSFGTFDGGTPNALTTMLWRSHLLSDDVGDPVSLTRLDAGQPAELWSEPKSAAATLPATSLRAANGDFVMVLQSFPKKGQDVTIAIVRLAADGTPIWRQTLVRSFDSAITDMTELDDDTLLFVGRSYDPSKEDGDAWLLTLQADGTIVSGSKTTRW